MIVLDISSEDEKRQDWPPIIATEKAKANPAPDLVFEGLYKAKQTLSTDVFSQNQAPV